MTGHNIGDPVDGDGHIKVTNILKKLKIFYVQYAYFD